jgi:hypothetical protein
MRRIPSIWLLKAELKQANITYAELAERLKEHGLEETKVSIRINLTRGTFPAEFLMGSGDYRNGRDYSGRDLGSGPINRIPSGVGI